MSRISSSSTSSLLEAYSRSVTSLEAKCRRTACVLLFRMARRLTLSKAFQHWRRRAQPSPLSLQSLEARLTVSVASLEAKIYEESEARAAFEGRITAEFLLCSGSNTSPAAHPAVPPATPPPQDAHVLSLSAIADFSIVNNDVTTTSSTSSTTTQAVAWEDDYKERLRSINKRVDQLLNGQC